MNKERHRLSRKYIVELQCMNERADDRGEDVYDRGS